MGKVWKKHWLYAKEAAKKAAAAPQEKVAPIVAPAPKKAAVETVEKVEPAPEPVAEVAEVAPAPTKKAVAKPAKKSSSRAKTRK